MKARILLVLVAAVVAAFAWPDYDRPIVKAATGEEYVSGHLVLQLSQSLRGKVGLTNQGGVMFFGIAALDDISRQLGVDDITQLLRNPYPSQIEKQLGCDMQYAVQFDMRHDVPGAIALYEALPEVEYACPDGVMHLDSMPNDPNYGVQWHLQKLQAPFAWGVARGNPSVVNCVIDDGVDMYHPDVQDNLWINTAEDINGNGRFDTLWAPDGDLDGTDQDGNGYTDDVVGFDFLRGDAIPMPEGGDAHGTHTWGTTNAVTNNGVGIAGPPWNTRSMGLRCGGGGTVSLVPATAAVYYGVAAGAWSFSMSFGGPTPYPPLQSACIDAWNSGCVLFGSAGNEYAENQRFPGCNEGVENVAASNSADMKADFSNWGTWVDVTAPGVNIYSTVPRWVGSYGSMDGTSMACPLAAGVACWIKSFMPGISNADAIQMLHDGCDSMPDPLYAQGKLGAGRVSLSNLILPTHYCKLQLSGWRFNEPSGNGRPDPGETVSLIVTLSNATGWQNATGVSADLACSSALVQMTKSHATFPDIPSGGTGSCSADSFVITLPSSVPPQILTFDLRLNSTPNPVSPDTTFTVQAGSPRVLIVDDDLGQDFEKYYKVACDSHGVIYDVFSVQSSGSPSADTLNHYPIVIWFTGNDASTTLTPADEANLTSFLNNGKNLLISGQNIAQDIDGSAFLSDYLHAQLLDDSTGKLYLPGINGDPITQGDTMVLAGAGGSSNGKSMDAVRPIGGAVGCARYKDYTDTAAYSLIRYAGAYRVVYFPCPFEAIDHSASRYLQKWTLIKRIFDFFGEALPGVEAPQPVIESRGPQLLSISPNPFQREARVSFTAPMTGNVGLRVFSSDGRLVQSEARSVTLGEQVSLRIDGSTLSNGVHLVQVVTPEGVYAQKTAVLR